MDSLQGMSAIFDDHRAVPAATGFTTAGVGDHFAIIAHQIGSSKVRSATSPLTAGADDHTTGYWRGATGDLRARGV